MTEANYTGNEKQKSFQEPFRTAELIGAMHNQLIFLSVLNKETSLHPPSKLLFRSLAASHLCIPIIARPLEVIYLMSGGEQKMEYLSLHICHRFSNIPNGVTAMLDDRTFCFVIQHGHHAIGFLHLQGLVANHPYLGKREAPGRRGNTRPSLQARLIKCLSCRMIGSAKAVNLFQYLSCQMLNFLKIQSAKS